MAVMTTRLAAFLALAVLASGCAGQGDCTTTSLEGGNPLLVRSTYDGAGDAKELEAAGAHWETESTSGPGADGVTTVEQVLLAPDGTVVGHRTNEYKGHQYTQTRVVCSSDLTTLRNAPLVPDIPDIPDIPEIPPIPTSAGSETEAPGEPGPEPSSTATPTPKSAPSPSPPPPPSPPAPPSTPPPSSPPSNTTSAPAP